MERPELLRVLDAILARDTAPSGLRGVVALGVETRGKTWWWRAELAAARGAFVDAPPPDADATLLVGEAEAAAILEGRELPASADLRLSGDPELLRRFVARYTQKRTALQLRAAGVTGRTGGRR